MANQIKFKTAKGNFVAVELPPGAVDFGISKNIFGVPYSLKYTVKNMSSTRVSYVGIDCNKFEIIGKPNELTEVKWAEIVSDNGMGCWDNYRLKKDEVYTCTSATASGCCLMETAGIPLDYLLLKIM